VSLALERVHEVVIQSTLPSSKWHEKGSSSYIAAQT